MSTIDYEIKNKKLNIQIYNSLNRKKEPFIPISNKIVGIYVCGPTVYDEVHLGNIRTFIFFDVVYRYLSFLGFNVRYVRNITDVGHLENDEQGEDKVEKKALKNKLEPMEIANKYSEYFKDCLKKLGNKSPNIEPIASGHIIEQIEFIKKILSNNLAYQKNNSVYLDLNKYMDNIDAEYGRLSGKKTDELLANTRNTEGFDDKKSPNDFALWKKAIDGKIMKWPSPWGYGIPGWHIECSAMSRKYLGEEFDIHGGGMDLKFPHHESEIAQSKSAYGKSPAKYWMHTNMLTIDKNKMSKSKGNMVYLDDILNETFTFKGNKINITYGIIRFYLLTANYKDVLDFSIKEIKKIAISVVKIVYDSFEKIKEIEKNCQFDDKSKYDLKDWCLRCYDIVNDDFNIPKLIAHLNMATKIINNINKIKIIVRKDDFKIFCAIFKGFLFDVLGLDKAYMELKDISDKNIQQNNDESQFIKDIKKLRLELRNNRNFQIADSIRDILSKNKIDIKDDKVD